MREEEKNKQYYNYSIKLLSNNNKTKTKQKPVNSVLFYSIKNKSVHHSPIAYTFYSTDDSS